MMLSGRAFVGGLRLATWCLGAKQFPELGAGDPTADSRLVNLFGMNIFERVKDRTVLDLGCGHGNEAVRFALEGAASVVAVDINSEFIDGARRLAHRFDVLDKMTFVDVGKSPDALDQLAGTIDVAFSIDAFEHYRDPCAMLRRFYSSLKEGGSLIVAFGPPWLHPYGAHMDHFCRLPWIHFFFAEPIVLKARERY